MPKFLSDLDILAPELTVTSSGANKPLLTLESTDDSTENQPEIKFYKNSASDASEDIGIITWRALDNGGTSTVYARILGEIEVNTNTDELGKLSLQARNESSYLDGIVIEGTATSGEIDVAIANGAASTTTIAGDLTVTTKITECKRKFSPTGSNTAGTNSGGDIVYIGTGDTVLGEIVHYKSDGTWEAADATDVTKCDGLLGVALGTDPDVNGVLLRGMVTIADIDGTEAVGMPLFLSEDATGHANMDAPEGNTNIVRIIGYCLHATNGEIWFNPDNTFVEVTT